MEAEAPIVLLVEDNEDNRIVYTTVLRHFGYQVDEAVSGDEALIAARRRTPDVILMDISVPGIDGYEVTRRLRQSGKTAATPIIALTAHALASDKRRALDAGCSDFLSKPCEPRQVVAAVGKWLEKSGRRLQPARAAGPAL